MEKRKKEYFDHALDRAIGRAARILILKEISLPTIAARHPAYG